MIIVTEGCEDYAAWIEADARTVYVSPDLQRLVEKFLTCVADYPADTTFVIPKGGIFMLLSGIIIDVPADAPVLIITSDKLTKTDITQLLHRFTKGPRKISIMQVATYLGGRP